MHAPLLGVAGSWGAAEIELHRRFDDLHQLIYRRGGLGSANAAVDELTKLLLIHLRRHRHPADRSDFRENSESRPQSWILEDYRRAFAAALRDPSLMARDPSGATHPLWPLDEPFRLAEPSVLAAADALVADLLATGAAMDPLGTAFDALLAGRYDHTGGLGTYLTPGGVARMMAHIAVPLVATPPSQVTGPGFGDPYCGTGRFLVALLTALPPRHPLRVAGPFGADVSASAVAKARLNLLLYGVAAPLVWTVTDSVTDPTVHPLAGQVPLILTNPPFGEGQYDSPAGIAATAAVMPALAGRSRIDPALACLARAVSLLAPGGVLGIVLPDGLLGCAPVRDLLAGDEVEPLAVVSLPAVTFALSGTVARTSALFLRRPLRSAPAGQVVVARVEHVGYVVRAGRPVADPAGDELPHTTQAVAQACARAGTPAAGGGTGGDDPSGEGGLQVVSTRPLVALTSPDDLAAFDPARLDPDALAARRSLHHSGGVPLAEYLDVVTPRRSRQVTTPFVSVLHIDDLGCVDWHAATEYAPVTPGVLAEPGELIVSLLNPASPRAAVIPSGPPVQVSAEFGVFRSTVDPYAVLGLLYSPPVRAQLRPLGTGTSSSRRRITPGDVLSLVVPKLDQSTQDKLATTVRSAQQQVRAARARLRAAYASCAAPKETEKRLHQIVTLR